MAIQFLQMDFPDDRLSVFVNLDRVISAKFQRDVEGTIDNLGDFHAVDTDTPDDAPRIKSNIFEMRLVDNDLYFSIGESADRFLDFFVNKANVYRV